MSAWRVSLEARGLGSSSIIFRMSAIRKLAAEAADNGLLEPEIAAGIARVRSAKSVGIRVGNWLSVRQAQSLLNAPDVGTVRGLRDRAILAVLLGCGLRRSEVAALTFTHLQHCRCHPITVSGLTIRSDLVQRGQKWRSTIQNSRSERCNRGRLVRRFKTINWCRKATISSPSSWRQRTKPCSQVNTAVISQSINSPLCRDERSHC